MLIKHPGARTRALYRWEREEIDARSKKWRMPKRSLLRFSERVWEELGWHQRHGAPAIVIRECSISACYGRSLIVLRPCDMHPAVVLHELAHARGYGEGAVMHPVSFVLKVIELYSYYLGWSYSRLFAQAALRGLV